MIRDLANDYVEEKSGSPAFLEEFGSSLWSVWVSFTNAQPRGMNSREPESIALGT